MKGNIWQLVVLAAVLALLLPAANIALGDSGHNATESENVTIDFSENSTLSPDQAHVLETYDNETVTNSSGVELQEGTDYEFYTETQEIEWFNTNRTSSGETANATYTYRYATGATHTAMTVLGALGQFIGLVFLITALGGLLVFVFGGGGF